AIACKGSNGLRRPTVAAVSGINCAMPCAPARLTMFGLKPLSWKRRWMKKGIGRSFDCAAAATVSQISLLEPDFGADCAADEVLVCSGLVFEISTTGPFAEGGGTLFSPCASASASARRVVSSTEFVPDNCSNGPVASEPIATESVTKQKQ